MGVPRGETDESMRRELMVEETEVGISLHGMAIIRRNDKGIMYEGRETGMRESKDKHEKKKKLRKGKIKEVDDIFS